MQFGGMKDKGYITFNDALKCRAPTAFSSMAKPAGSACNLSCKYCYYLGKASAIYDEHQPVMSPQILEEYIRQYINANEVPEVTFVWHGGEPLLAGIDYYRLAVKLQNKYADGKTIANSLQTNGLLLNDDWGRFFHDNRFLLGLSIDGPQDIHDAYRVSKARRPTFCKVMDAINLIKKHNIEFNTLSVVTDRSEGRGAEVYRFLKSTGSRYMQFLAAVEHILNDKKDDRPVIVKPGTKGSTMASWSVSAAGYGKFMSDIFDAWVVSDVGEYFVQPFDMSLSRWVGLEPGLCIHSETCGDALVVEHNGDVYSCDHFVYPEYRLGNILDTDLSVLYRSPKQFRFGINKRNSLPGFCLKCKYYFVCRGECPKHRFCVSGNEDYGLSALCEGLRYFYAHVEPYMEYMAMLLAQKRSPAMVMPWARVRIKG